MKLPTLVLCNETTTSSTAALMRVLRRVFTLGWEVFFSIHRDSITTRAERTRKLGGVEVLLYEDGSGVEVACMGWLLALGVEEVAPAQPCHPY